MAVLLQNQLALLFVAASCAFACTARHKWLCFLPYNLLLYSTASNMLHGSFLQHKDNEAVTGFVDLQGKPRSRVETESLSGPTYFQAGYISPARLGSSIKQASCTALQ